MKKKLGMGLFVTALAVLWAFPALAIAPPPTPNPNGFISGPHYNLNIIGKKEGFVCPEPTYDEFGNRVYGNVIFIPEYGTDQNIYMQSGKASKFAAVSELQVIDDCTFNDGKATLQLPKSANGYWVFARTLAKPGSQDDPRNISIIPSLDMVQDEAGNELWFQGYLNSDGTVCKDLNPDDGTNEVTCSLTRSKGKSTAANITNIFEWSGSVCYFDLPTDVSSTEKQLCCYKADTDGDGYADEWVDCYEPVDGLCKDDGSELTMTYCADYTSEWVFNIGDIVDYLWDVDNSGVKLTQIRFYPIP